ncbi:MAG: RecQ family ATP-dependent DNA helicase [Chlorobi bacterium]|nr:RecQ family ATP-dependent DNA helicase [Chlorobiota bacterium]
MDIYHEILKKYWGYSEFRPLQLDIIRSVGEGRDTLGLMPTGGGKSLTFQVPALAKKGLCLVVTPLIALMNDQVRGLNERGIKALAIHSGLPKNETDIIIDNCIHGDFKFLYLSPERLGNEMFRKKLAHMTVNLIAVDEAHCISQWGYDFRPSYQRIAEVRELFPDVPVLALTATATPEVVDDIQVQLKFKEKNVFRKSFYRKNLAYVVRKTEDKETMLIRILSSIRGSAIVYVRNRKKTKEYTEFLLKKGIRASYFHAGLKPEIKTQRQHDWTSGKVRVMVSTNAFGMGIDKPDVRLVVHMTAPDSIEAYFQEAGRAGRDGKKAYAVLLWSPHDKASLNRMLTNSFPEPETIKRVYDALGNFFQIASGAGEGATFDFNLGRFCEVFKFNVLTAYNSLKILHLAGYIEYTEDLQLPSRVHITVDRKDLYEIQLANQQLDVFIKLLLRSYTGLFTQYVAIDEDLLAKRLHKTRNDIYNYLKTLAQLKVILYNPQKRTPLITFTHPRIESRHLILRKEIYDERKVRLAKRIESIIEYATINHICRSRLLLSYFGENTSENCGICDVCIEKKKTGIDDNQFDKIKSQIENILSSGAISYDELMSKTDESDDVTEKVLKWLEEYDIVTENSNGLLEWNSNKTT